jgi:hypothetical protein
MIHGGAFGNGLSVICEETLMDSFEQKWRERDKAKVLNTTEDLEKNLAAAQLRAESSKGKALKNAESDIKKYQQGLDTAHTKLTMM